MQVFLKAIGDLRDYFGRDEVNIELPEGAVVRDLLEAIHVRWGADLPDYLWCQQTHKFKGAVLIVVEKKAIKDPATPLANGMKIYLFRAVAGG